MRPKNSMRSYLQKHEYLLLNIFMILTILLYPLYFVSTHASLIFHILLSGVILSGTYASWEYKKFVPIVIGLWVVTFLLTRAEFISPDSSSFILLYMVSIFLFFLVVTAKVIWTIINHPIVDAHVIYGGISWYLMLGMAGSFLFGIVEILIPGSYNIVPTYIGNIPEYIYYSFTTMTTLWYGDIYPLSHAAQMRSVLITVFGQVYLTVFMWVLIGKYISQKRKLQNN